jgi:7-cyano-7-deazaguanine synthase
LNRNFTISRRLTEYHKEDVIRIGHKLGVPMELSLSCMNPTVVASKDEEQDVIHCGACSKCRERRDAFMAAGVPDRTAYAVLRTRER